MYLQGLRQVAGTCEKVTTACIYLQDPRQVTTSTCDSYNTHSMYLQDPRQVTSTHDKVTTHTVRTYKTRDRSPVQVTKLQHSMYLQDPRQVAITGDKITTHTACTYKTQDS